MTKFTFLAAVALLSTLIATRALAQAAIGEPGEYAFYHPNSDLGLGNAQPWPRPAYGASAPSNAMASAPFRSRVPSHRWVHHHASEDRR
jgi:hypothetical protein